MNPIVMKCARCRLQVVAHAHHQNVGSTTRASASQLQLRRPPSRGVLAVNGSGTSLSDREQEPTHVVVGAEDLLQAVLDGKRNIELQSHLDLTKNFGNLDVVYILGLVPHTVRTLRVCTSSALLLASNCLPHLS
jgi:hypothetical protein